MTRALKDINEAIRLDGTNSPCVCNPCVTVWLDVMSATRESWTRPRPSDSIHGSAGKASHPALALLPLRKGDHDKAIENLTEAIRLKPDEPRAYFNRIASYLATRQWDKAVADGDSVVRLYPDYPDAVHHRGLARFEKGDWEGALADIEKTLRLDPKHRVWPLADPNPCCGRPVRNAKFRDAEKALKDANRACELTKWKLSSTLEAYAAACAENGDFAEAVKWQEKVLDDTDYMAQRGEKAKQRLELYKAKKPYRIIRD